MKFACPHCSQNIEADAEYAGQQVDCPTCKHTLRVPQPSDLHKETVAQSRDINFECTNCGRSILIDKAGAGQKVQCPSCGQSLTVPDIDKAPNSVPAPVSMIPTPRVSETKKYPVNTGSSGKAEISQNVSPLAKEFPDWDLMPPAILVRRKSASSRATTSPAPTTAAPPPLPNAAIVPPPVIK